MARPIKQGLDYYPQDCVDNTGLQLLEAECTIIGYAVVIKLYQQIFQEHGYYLPWDTDIAILFAKKCAIELSQLESIMEVAVKRDIFDKEKYQKESILTSVWIQNTFFEITKRRKNVEVREEYLLVSAPQKSENVDNNGVNVDNNPENAYQSTQSKVKKSKEKKSKAITAQMQDFGEMFERFWLVYPKKKNKGDAEKAFRAAKLTEELLIRILSALSVQKQSHDWKKEDGKYIPYPASWLRGRRWEDEDNSAAPMMGLEYRGGTDSWE